MAGFACMSATCLRITSSIIPLELHSTVQTELSNLRVSWNLVLTLIDGDDERMMKTFKVAIRPMLAAIPRFPQSAKSSPKLVCSA